MMRKALDDGIVVWLAIHQRIVIIQSPTAVYN